MYRRASPFPPSTTTTSLAAWPADAITATRASAPVGVTTQDVILEQRLEPQVGAKRVRNYLKTLNMELTMLARACGKQNVHHLEKEDLVALTIEAAAMAGIPLAGTSWIPET
jgi:glutamate synthase domain-containing protein 2